MCRSRFAIPDEFDQQDNGTADIVAKIEAGVALSRYYRPRKRLFPQPAIYWLLIATTAITIAGLVVHLA